MSKMESLLTFLLIFFLPIIIGRIRNPFLFSGSQTVVRLPSLSHKSGSGSIVLPDLDLKKDKFLRESLIFLLVICFVFPKYARKFHTDSYPWFETSWTSLERLHLIIFKRNCTRPLPVQFSILLHVSIKLCVRSGLFYFKGSGYIPKGLIGSIPAQSCSICIKAWIIVKKRSWHLFTTRKSKLFGMKKCNLFYLFKKIRFLPKRSGSDVFYGISPAVY